MCQLQNSSRTMSAELLLGFIGAADACIKLANEALSTYRAYRHAEEDLETESYHPGDSLGEAGDTNSRPPSPLGRGKRLNSYELAQCHLTLLQRLQDVLSQAILQLEMAASSVKSDDKVLNMFMTGRVKSTRSRRTRSTRWWPSWRHGRAGLISHGILNPHQRQRAVPGTR
ncbi:hypothetical protein N657DRAFT_690926 [Parathielavia appendiculata]|uniref:Uncharacterized protein n=1 Tax=Parathielavia appendiculata TaxID=2587402 RepID=A0AAN6Z418_9PEZI|nr:hypothetical protein N657DRAFT_690926 [Parathielavia appendiculata]